MTLIKYKVKINFSELRVKSFISEQKTVIVLA